MPKKIKMNTTHASPTEVLHEGKIYTVSDELAKALMAEGSGADGKPAARLAKGSELRKAVRPSVKPDPGEKEPDGNIDDEDEDINTEAE